MSFHDLFAQAEWLVRLRLVRSEDHIYLHRSGWFFPDDQPVEFQSGPRKNSSEKKKKTYIFIASYSITDISLTYHWHIIHEWSRLDLSHHPAPAWSRQLPSNHPEWTNWRELAPHRNPCSWRTPQRSWGCSENWLDIPQISWGNDDHPIGSCWNMKCTFFSNKPRKWFALGFSASLLIHQWLSASQLTCPGSFIEPWYQ